MASSMMSQSLQRSCCPLHQSLRQPQRASGRVVVARGSKKVSSVIKLAIEAGKANPSPPVGPALGAAGVNIMEFCKQYNAATQDKVGETVPVDITVFEDRSFTFVMKTAPTSMLIMKAAGIKKGSGEPQKAFQSITEDQLEEIAKVKLPDLNCTNMESAKRVVHGTCRNMGITVDNRRHRGDPSIMTSKAELAAEEEAQEELQNQLTPEELDAAADAAEEAAAEAAGETEGEGEAEGAEEKEAVAA